MSSHSVEAFDKPQQSDLDRCVHCGLCLNACPTYRELHVEMDSPRGRIYQMVQVAGGAAISPSYIEHIDLCLACRGCETACPSGVEYGRLVEAARAEIESKIQRPWRERLIRWLVFRKLLPNRLSLEIAGALLYLYQASGLKRLVGMPGFLPSRLRELEALAPDIETPFFFAYYGKTLPADALRTSVSRA
jgi:glycolate oxidase iron-sulfur subunit